MQHNNNINNNASIAFQLKEIASELSTLDSSNLSQSIAKIEAELLRIDVIANENSITALRAVTHWMTLNTEITSDNEDRIQILLEENSYVTWIEVIASLLEVYDQSLLPILHQSLTNPNWLIKPSAPILKSIAVWIEGSKIKNQTQEEHSDLNVISQDENSNTDDSISATKEEQKAENTKQSEKASENDETEFEQRTVFEEIDSAILEIDYDDCTAEVLKELQEHPDFKVPLVETEKSSEINKEENSNIIKNEPSSDDSLDDSSSITDDTTSDFSNELDDIVMTLTSIPITSDDFLSNIDSFCKELRRLTLLAEISSFYGVAKTSDWCERNLKLFAENKTQAVKVFVSSGECWTWIELVNICILDPEEISNFSTLATELSREEWQEPIDLEDLRTLLLCLKGDHEQVLETKFLHQNTTEKQKITEITDSDVPEVVDEIVVEEKHIETSGLQLTWDDSTHPELLAVYLEETPTQIVKIKPLLTKISTDQADKEERQTASRMAHTIKGGSAIVGITALADYSYQLETILDFSIKHPLPKELSEILPVAGDCLENLFDAVQSHQAEPAEFFPLLTTLKAYIEAFDDKDDEPLELTVPQLPDFILNQSSDLTDETKISTLKEDTDSAVETVIIEDAQNDEEVNTTEKFNLEKPESTDETNEISDEIDNIIMTLSSISSTSSDVLSNIDEYSAELQRFELLCEISGYSELSTLSEWCQLNLGSFSQNATSESKLFLEMGEAWLWLEHTGAYLKEPDEISHLSALSTELLREEWDQPFTTDKLQALLLALRNSSTESASEDETIVEHMDDIPVAESIDNEAEETIEKDNKLTKVIVNEEEFSKEIISWDDDVHPELLSVYFQETPDQITEVAALLHKISSGKADSEDHKKAARIAHTIKGASGVVGISSLVDLTHRLEDILDFSVNNKLPTKTSELLAEASDCLESLFETIQNKTDRPEEYTSVLAQLSEYADSLGDEDQHTADDTKLEMPELPDFVKTKAKPKSKTKTAAKKTKTKTTIKAKSKPKAKSKAKLGAKPKAKTKTDDTSEVTNKVPSPSDQSDKLNTSSVITETHIRVPVNVIDRLLNLAGELVTTSSQVSDHLDKTLLTSKMVKTQDTRVHKMLDELSITISQQEKDQETRLTNLQDSGFDSLEMDSYNELHSVAGLLTESILDNEEIDNTLATQLKDLTDDLRSLDKLNKELSEVILRSRMVSINTLVPRLERIVRQTCRKTGKQAELIVTGKDINIDTDILNGLVDPLLHLLRNAVDHGIEFTEIRKSNGKEEFGKIQLSFTREGNNILMQLKDDGAGIDPEIIYQKAIEKGMITPDQEFSTNQTLKLILQPGFSTQKNVSDISGRGVGMDVVNSAVEDLKGTLQISSDIDKGTSFDIKIPLTLVTNTTLLVMASGNPVAIPSDTIEQLLYLSATDVIERDGIHYIKHENQELKIQSLSELLEWPSAEIDFSQSHTLLLIKTDDQMYVVHIEEIVYSREVVVKNLNPWVSTTKGVVGACHLNDGGVAPVLNLAHVLENASKDIKVIKNARSKRKSSIEVKHIPQILVVDDSLSNRKALSLIIEQTDYTVITAVDGLDALQIMNENPVDMVFTDLEMPRMNGLELTQAIRAWTDKKKTPIVMITSRTTSKHRELAEKAGVDDYLTKPVVTDTLLESLNTWLQQIENV